MDGAARRFRSSGTTIELRRLSGIVWEKYFGVAVSHGFEPVLAKTGRVNVLPGVILHEVAGTTV
jgi:hypothetical protein